jgi:starch synthase
MPPLHVVMAAPECVPFAKVGGLGDVMGALPRALEKLGVSVSVVIPRHRVIDLAKFGFESCPIPGTGSVPVGFENVPYDVHCGKLPGSSVNVFLLGNDRFFDRPGVYFDPATGHGYWDEGDRWVFFQRAVMEFFKNSSPAPDILHCHDHQTALLPAYLNKFYRSEHSFPRTRSIFTIHNMGYQGHFPREMMVRAGFHDSEFYYTSPFEFYGLMNFMKIGISFADLITTVSPTYAREIQERYEFGVGLEGLLRERSQHLIGILNGIDMQVWNPATDPLIAARYSTKDLSPKLKNKKAVLEKFGLNKARLDWPLLAMISRIDVQKGFDLLTGIFDYLLSKDLHFVLLGSGNKDIEGHLRWLIEQHPGKAGMRLEFDNNTAHLIEAGADMFLMPSRYEPCGLNQMYSLRYGTVPIVRSTGGLADTVQEFNPENRRGNGFIFAGYDPEHFKAAIDRALSIWPRNREWKRIMLNGMQQDFSWTQSAKKYLSAYQRVMQRF